MSLRYRFHCREARSSASQVITRLEIFHTALAKGALDRIVLAAARELAHMGITANVVNPGPVDTGWMDEATRSELLRRQPGKSLGTPQSVADVIALLLSPEGAWINGQLIRADGGCSA